DALPTWLLREDGRPSKPIVGVPLNGAPGVREIPDTDRGLLDGDPVHDRAVGPMQFIPSTWNKWATDGNGDGIGDPQNIDDAAMAAARYLCAGGRDLSTGAGWWSAVMSYNHPVEYAQEVVAMAERYGEVASRRRRPAARRSWVRASFNRPCRCSVRPSISRA